MAKTIEKLPKTDQGLQAWLQNRKPPAEREWLALGHGLTVCIAPSGDKTFQARLRRIGDKNARRITIGHFPETSVAEARQKLLAARAAVKSGRDPALDRRRAREGIETVATFGRLLDLYLIERAEKGHQRGSRKGKPLAAKTMLMQKRAVAMLRKALGDRLLDDIKPLDVSTVIDREEKRLRKAGRTGRAANIALGVARQAFKFARQKGHLRQNPAADLDRPASEIARARILYDSVVLKPSPDEHGVVTGDEGEIGRLAEALADLDTPGPDRGTRAALLLALLLGMRANEVASLQWSAVHLDDSTPALTVVRAKTAAGVRTLPLPRQAADLLRALKMETPKKTGFVFPARNEGGRAEHLHPESLSRAFSRLCDRLDIKEAVLHDLRRTALSAIVELKGDTVLAERIAGHKGTTTLSKHYDQSTRLTPMLDALTQWADAIDAARARAKESST
ncbi:integrase family protein [Methylocystis sp. L43]|uniref:tyrosine-type recombinase/integrase n=1 Tax=unclassified Methylocystis TaxID=2625913 RepID=UPI0018C30862|nr:MULTISPECIES: integrase family protein [unclassified Methylocystis]MBG0796658.1 integrase family protein [Methylocystis sp. L43]MBG0804623.1 integrase family protein [Methylocystis sp. H15]